MDEKFTREKKEPSRRRVEPENETKQKTYGSKLKNDMSRSEAMRKKLRTGKADNSETLKEKKKRAKLRKQGRKKAYTEAAIASRARSVAAAQNEDNSAAGDSINAGTTFAEGTIYSAKAKSRAEKKSGYGKKLHEKKHTEEAKQLSKTKEAGAEVNKQAQKNLMKKEIQKQAYKQRAKEAANGAGSVTKKFVDKAEDMVGKLAEAVTEFLTKFVSEHPLGALIAVLILILVLVISGALTSCSMAGGGAGNMTLETSYTAQDSDIIAVNESYKNLEEGLQETIDNIETDYPGYDEYNYTLNEISHNPFELAALLTVLYEDYTPSEVASMLLTIMDEQYELDIEEVVETRTRTVTEIDPETGDEIEVEEEYEYYILNVTLTNHGVDYVARNKMGLTSEQLQRYEVLLETFGNKKYLFEDDPYAAPQPGEYQDYNIPSEYLTDVEFGNMIHEAEKYLGYPYVWGGSSPSTSFDCSGFVSYVINNCGNGWNVGRQTANGLLNNCTRVSKNNAKPGDLIFFQGTYNTSGASHVGIYVGDGMMIHCGNPIQYTSINSSYWQSHFYTFGRLNH